MKSLLATTIAALACSCTASAEEPVARQAAAILAAGGGPVFADWKSRPGSNSARPLLKPIIHLAYSSDGRRLAQGTSSGVVTIWDVANEQEAAHFEADCNQQIAFARNGVTVGAAGYKGAYHLWEAKSGEEYRQIAGKFGTLALNESGCAAFSPDLDEVALGAADGQVRILATASGRVIRTFRAYSDEPVFALAYSRDGKVIATAGASGIAAARPGELVQNRREAVALWESSTGKLIKELDCVMAGDPPPEINPVMVPRPEVNSPFWFISFSPNGATIAASNGTATVVWDLDRGRQLIELTDGVGHYSADGSMLLFVQENSIKALELDSGRICWSGTLSTPDPSSLLQRGALAREFSPLAMAPDDRTCAVALGGDSVAAILSLAPPDWHPPAKSAGEFSDADLPRLWTALAGEDAPAAYSATWRLRLGGNRTVEYIREHFVATPVDPHETKRIELLIAQLDNDSYEKRQLAVRSLTDLGSAAEAAMRKSLKETTSFEVRARLRQILAALDNPIQRHGGEALRRMRAIRVLQRIDTRQATEYLRILAAGPPTARETSDAKAAAECRQARANASINHQSSRSSQ